MSLNLIRPACGSYLNRRKGLLFLVIALAFLLFQLLPSSNLARSPSDIKPEFLWHSPYRDNPDEDYEARIRNALKYIEQVSLEHGDNKAIHKIWQVLLGTGENTDGRGQDSHDFQDRNSDWDHEVLSSKWAQWFLDAFLNLVPDLRYYWKAYPDEHLRADLLRYLVMWYHGGYYADLDVVPVLPIRDCPALQETVAVKNPKAHISLVVGIETDEPFATPEMGAQWQGARKYGFVQYNLYAPRRFSPLLREVIVRVLSHTKQHFNRQRWLFGEFYDHYTQKMTHEITGPGVFTDAILDALSENLPSTHPLVAQSTEAEQQYTNSPPKRVTWAPFHGLQEPVCVDDSESATGKHTGGLCVLPASVWGAGQRDSNSPDACIDLRLSGNRQQDWITRLMG
ncbi:hypothetical protein N7510_001546 [Penicillium lagena]|uniref:uncharacterized protein n=1 Tax=Penicillium lagena TaxID=94218 RepID=UPI00253F8223|nr:uncharacterized protein N7510_001546 [Penicillium lagena]KAJ5625237.1 hypothetical protein N7510_001546 [Penicillium lagena]